MDDMILDIMTTQCEETLMKGIKKIVAGALAGNFDRMVELMVILCIGSLAAIAVGIETLDHSVLV
jgi:hypothetical protein